MDDALESALPRTACADVHPENGVPRGVALHGHEVVASWGVGGRTRRPRQFRCPRLPAAGRRGQCRSPRIQVGARRIDCRPHSHCRSVVEKAAIPAVCLPPTRPDHLAGLCLQSANRFLNGGRQARLGGTDVRLKKEAQDWDWQKEVGSSLLVDARAGVTLDDSRQEDGSRSRLALHQGAQTSLRGGQPWEIRSRPPQKDNCSSDVSVTTCSWAARISRLAWGMVTICR